jgi:hypothetical protein
MKLFVQLLGVIASAGLGLMVGFMSRVNSERASGAEDLHVEKPARTDKGPAPTLPSDRKLKGPRAPDDSPLATKLARELYMSSRITRWLYWTEAIEKASPSDFPRLSVLAKGDATATRLVALRWLELDWQHLFNTVSSPRHRRNLPTDELAEALFYEWTRRDPDAAIDALRGTNNLGTREAWRFNVAGYLVEKDPDRGLRALSEWGIDNFAPRMSGVAKWAAADPRHAAEAVLANPAGYTSQLAMETIGKEWAKVDASGAVEFASSRPGELAAALANAVLKSWASRNLQEAAHWLVLAKTSTRYRLSPAFVETWAKTDPDGALAWAEANLKGSTFARTVHAVVNGAVLKDLTATAEFVTKMKPSPARAEAAVAVAKNWFPTWRSGKPVPAAAIAWMSGLDTLSTRRALEYVQWKWSNGDPKSMADFLAAMESDKVPPSADLHLARALVRRNPAEAFVWTSRLPSERAVAAGREAFAEWRRSQPELASKWLNDLPISDPRRDLFLKNEIR